MQRLNTDEEHDSSENTVYLRFASTIFTYLSQRLGNLQDAEDLLLEVFITAFKDETFTNLPAERQLIWLRRVARNKVIDLHRHTILIALLPLEHAAEMEDKQLTPEQNIERQENFRHLYQALRKLSSDQQELIQLRYGNGLRFAEIASILTKPEGTLRKLLARTLHQLRTYYDQIERGK